MRFWGRIFRRIDWDGVRGAVYEGLEEENETGVGLGDGSEFGGDGVVFTGWVGC